MIELIDNIPDTLFRIFIFNIIIVNIGMLLVFIYNNPIALDDKKNKKIKNIFNELLNELILNVNKIDLKQNHVIRQLKVLEKRRVKIIFIKMLREYAIFLKGKEFEALTEIYKSIDLHVKDMKDLESRRTKTILNAIERLNRFKIVVDREKMRKLQKHSSPEVRELANSYTLNIYKDPDIFEFLDFTKEPFTPWQRLEYFQLIINNKEAPIIEFSKWIHPNYDNSLILLALDLCGHYKQKNAAPAIRNLLNITNDSKVRSKLIKTLGIINDTDAIEFLMELFKTENEVKCKIEIIRSLGYLGYKNGKVELFLKNLIRNESSISIKKAAIIGLNRVNSSFSALEKRIYNFDLEKLNKEELKVI
ncbi:MAG: HEAT repeat domain-containing protein [Flavobacterium sp.]|nr:HEAT repeat domain-containing protein [Flavobacterium sp.]